MLILMIAGETFDRSIVRSPEKLLRAKVSPPQTKQKKNPHTKQKTKKTQNVVQRRDRRSREEAT